MRLRRLLSLLIGILMVLALAGCGSQASQSASSAAEATATVSAENAATHDDPADYTWNEASVVDIVLKGTSISTNAAGAAVNGSTVTLTAAGTYRFTGSLSDGQIVVDTKDNAVVRLILNGVEITNADGPAILVSKAEKVVVALAKGTMNRLADSASYKTTTANSDEPNATLYSTSNLTIFGDGSLTVDANYNDGIASKDGLIIASGTITVDAVDDGIRGKDYLVVKDGNLSVTAGGDGLKADNAEDATKGYVSVAAGSITVKAGTDAIDAETDAIVSGGKLTLNSGGGSGAKLGQDVSAKGIKGTVSVAISGGTIGIDSADDAIHSNNAVVIGGGTVTIATGDDAVHADSALQIDNGVVNVTRSYEGLESANITINGGEIHIVATDDGINVAGGNDGSGTAMTGGAPGNDRFAQRGAAGAGAGTGGAGGGEAVGNYYLTINGGTITIDAEGDGLDSNGSITMTGGVVVVHGPTRGGNGALDANGTFNMTGGTLVAACSDAGMAESITQPSSQAAVYLKTSIKAETLIHLETADGKDVLTFLPTKNVAVLVFSSPDLVSGTAYNVYLGGNASGASLAGLYQSDAYTPGTKTLSVTAKTP
ncbi:MAG: carbohydrate-binding domain-containing protein [Coriobacteriia bacterium]|nr:carbohydrate-binding domain-containing protein [Coriobacteriia bacterium]